jgi:diaminopimelate decarboxylase
MNHFEYRDGALFAEDVALARIAEAVGTPFYCYSTATLQRHYQIFAEAFDGVPAKICYGVKANSNLAVVGTLAAMGAGADVVSEGELRLALAAGVPAGRIVYSGVGKTKGELAFALEAGIYQINVESEPELEALSEVASSKGLEAPITIRVNPDVDAKTHAKISTGRAENKFGIPWGRVREVYKRAAAMPGIRIVGIDMHIGSQITDLGPFEQAYRRMADMAETLRTDGHAIERLDLGGGLGIPYEESNTAPPLPLEYGAMAKRVLGHLGCELILEPGRMLVGNAGVLVSSVIYMKEGENRSFAILDAAMNDLLRPSLYGAYHNILPLRQAAANVAWKPVDFVGPICETGDTFAEQRSAPPLAAGDLVAICTSGAYGAVMSSTYNARPLIPEVLVKGDRFSVVRKRPSYDDMLAQNEMPDWLEEQPMPNRGAA